MFQNYLKIAWRNLKQNKAYALINITGLSLGIACSILIFTLLTFHLSFDNFHNNKDRIFRIVTEFHGEQVGHVSGVPSPLGKAIRNDFSFGEKVARVSASGDQLITINGETIKKFKEEDGVAFAESDFFEIFNFPLIQGDKKTALIEPNTAVITEQLAMKYYGTTNAIGKIFRLDNRFDFKVNGILKDLPTNTDRRQQIYLSFPSLKDWNAWLYSDSSWGGVSSSFQCFVLLKKGITKEAVEKALPATSKKYYNADDAKVFNFRLQPLSTIHFDPRFGGYADKKYLWALAFVGLFLVITACVNFVNLATAQALNRSREVGVRKVLGSLQSQLFWQFIAETAIITLFATIIACGIAQLTLPFLNNLFEVQMSIAFLSNVKLPLFLLSTAILVVFLSGSYPGLVLARFQPVIALKGKLSQRSIGGISLRRILVVTQFAISQILIIGTIVIASQMKFSKTSDLGFSKEAIVLVPIPTTDKTKMSTFRNKLSAVTGVDKNTFCYQAPAARDNSNTSILYDNRPKEEIWSVNMKQADDKYLETFGLKLLAGRNLYPADTTKEYLVNQTFVKKLSVLNPNDVLGKVIKVNGTEGTIVGVVNDFYNYSFRDEMAAVAIMPDYTNYNFSAIKITAANVTNSLAAIEKIWNEIYPEYVYDHTFLDESIGEFYELDNMMFTLIQAFAFIAIFIGCLGLYGLVSFMAVRKTKEIGVRKVLGASVQNILWMFGKEFTRLLLIAFFIAAPIAWYVMQLYLQDFKYRIPFGPGIFLAAIGATFLVAALTVGYQSIKSSLANPVKSLRSE
ncbi:MAG: ABC transporter permease [Bacteroidota bacterium]